MSKMAIVYASVHHGNTKKLLDAITETYDVDLIDATKIKEKDMQEYAVIGFASGIYYAKFHKAVLCFAKANLPVNQKIFLLYTCGVKADYGKFFMNEIQDKQAERIGEYGCLGFDTYGPFKLAGGIAKGHPDEAEISGAVDFIRGLQI